VGWTWTAASLRPQTSSTSRIADGAIWPLTCGAMLRSCPLATALSRCHVPRLCPRLLCGSSAFFRPPCPCRRLAAPGRRRSRWSAPRSLLLRTAVCGRQRERGTNDLDGRRAGAMLPRSGEGRAVNDRPRSGHRSCSGARSARPMSVLPRHGYQAAGGRVQPVQPTAGGGPMMQQSVQARTHLLRASDGLYCSTNGY
jgi:hypothetical protein